MRRLATLAISCFLALGWLAIAGCASTTAAPAPAEQPRRAAAPAPEDPVEASLARECERWMLEQARRKPRAGTAPAAAPRR